MGEKKAVSKDHLAMIVKLKMKLQGVSRGWDARLLQLLPDVDQVYARVIRVFGLLELEDLTA
jgi:hypothetical protein